MSLPDATTCTPAPPLFFIIQRCAELSAQIRSKVATPAGGAISANFNAPGQVRMSFGSLDKQRFVEPEAFLKHTESPLASLRVPLVAGDAVDEIYMPVNVPVLPELADEPIGIMSMVARMSPAEQLGPSLFWQITIFTKVPFK